jgi:hypothetical protein
MLRSINITPISTRRKNPRKVNYNPPSSWTSPICF